jgi:hypothetical protein
VRLALSLLLLVSACSLALDVGGTVGRPCSSEGECLAGYACVSGQCVTAIANGGRDGASADAGVDAGPADAGGEDGGGEEDAGPDAGADGGTDAGAPDAAADPRPLPGELVLSEILVNAPGTGEPGEYFEVYNASARPLDLRGCELGSASGASAETHLVQTAVPVAPFQYALFARSGSAAAVGATPAYVYSGITFANTSPDHLAIHCAGALIDGIAWNGSSAYPSVPASATDTALERSVASLGQGAAAPATKWCPATSAVIVTLAGAPATYLGTPGAPNACP